jgi:Na+/H+-dicarboxylate symporter
MKIPAMATNAAVLIMVVVVFCNCIVILRWYISCAGYVYVLDTGRTITNYWQDAVVACLKHFMEIIWKDWE